MSGVRAGEGGAGPGQTGARGQVRRPSVFALRETEAVVGEGDVCPEGDRSCCGGGVPWDLTSVIGDRNADWPTLRGSRGQPPGWVSSPGDRAERREEGPGPNPKEASKCPSAQEGRGREGNRTPAEVGGTRRGWRLRSQKNGLEKGHCHIQPRGGGGELSRPRGPGGEAETLARAISVHQWGGGRWEGGAGRTGTISLGTFGCARQGRSTPGGGGRSWGKERGLKEQSCWVGPAHSLPHWDGLPCLPVLTVFRQALRLPQRGDPIPFCTRCVSAADAGGSGTTLQPALSWGKPQRAGL